MKKRYLSLFLLFPLIACDTKPFVISTTSFTFGTAIDIVLNEGNEQNLTDMEDILSDLDALTDYYLDRDVNNVYTINHTNELVETADDLTEVISLSLNGSSYGAKYFNPLCGSLSEKWKEALNKGEVLSETVIQEELEKINNTHIECDEINNTIQRVGEATLDLGGIAKGYAIDSLYTYLKSNNITHYLINGGRSSILVGEKINSDGYYRIGLSKEYPNHHIKVKNCVVSTSGNTEQGKVIEGEKYSHIVNPITGMAKTNYDEVIVISSLGQGFKGDMLSTSFMLSTIDEIKEVETSFDVCTIVIKDHEIIYRNPLIEVYKN